MYISDIFENKISNYIQSKVLNENVSTFHSLSLAFVEKPSMNGPFSKIIKLNRSKQNLTQNTRI